jgi:hypothetical protein
MPKQRFSREYVRRLFPPGYLPTDEEVDQLFGEINGKILIPEDQTSRLSPRRFVSVEGPDIPILAIEQLTKITHLINAELAEKLGPGSTGVSYRAGSRPHFVPVEELLDDKVKQKIEQAITPKAKQRIRQAAVAKIKRAAKKHGVCHFSQGRRFKVDKIGWYEVFPREEAEPKGRTSNEPVDFDKLLSAAENTDPLAAEFEKQVAEQKATQAKIYREKREKGPCR